MKKYILPFLLFTFLASAQAPRGFFISAGANSTSLKSDDLLADSGVGYKAGLVFNWGYRETHNYQIEIFANNSQLKMLQVDQDFNENGTSNASFQTIDVGLFFNYYVLKPEEDKFYCGPQGGINLAFGGQLETKGGDNDYYLPYRLQQSQLDDMPTVLFGAGIGLTGGYNDFRFDLRYTMGLSNLLANTEINQYDETSTYTGPSLKGKLNVISFTLSYRLRAMFGNE